MQGLLLPLRKGLLYARKVFMSEEAEEKIVTIENLYDSYLNINTQRDGPADDMVEGEFDNTYEVTSYFFLERLFGAFHFFSDDHLVDFGCGKGRVLFMASHFNCGHVTGYEKNKARFDVLVNNIGRYQEKHGKETSFDVYNTDVKSAIIQDTASKLFFFEPFHLNVFRPLLKNINESLKRNEREMTIFLYLPHESTLEYFDSLKGFKREIMVDSTLFYQDETLAVMPQFAFYSNYSMTDYVNPDFLLY